MADLQKVKIGTTYYNLKDAKAREDIATNAAAIAAEVSRATGAESGLDTRITNLEARGRFLSNYDVATGEPTTYPEVPSGQTSYTYTFKSGDYYIVGNVPSSGKKYMPSGGSISTTDGGTSWTVGKAETTASISTGDQFVYDGSNWVHIAAAKDVAWGQIVGTLADQTDLQGALDLKADQSYLGALASVDTASGHTTLSTIDDITLDAITVAGNATVTTTKTEAELAYTSFTPAGTVTGSVTALGSVNVVLKDEAAKSEASITYGSYTPAGTIAATTGGNFSALTKATFEQVLSTAAGAVQIGGTVTAPAINFTPNETPVISYVKYSATLPSFSEGAFTAATWTGSEYTAPTWTDSSYTAPTLGAASSSAFAFEGVTVSVNVSASVSDPDFECLVFTAAGTSNALTAQGSFNAGNVTFGSFGAGNVAFGSFYGGSKAADEFKPGSASVETSTANVLNSATTAALSGNPVFSGSYYANNILTDTALKTVAFTGTAADIKATKVEYYKQEVSSAAFTGSSADITATFAGASASIVVNKVSYEKADATAAFTSTVTPTISAGGYNRTSKNINITVSTNQGE